MIVNRRRLAMLGLFGLVAPSAALAAKPAPKPRSIVQTYLRALPDRRADLSAFIKANWLPMDRKGIDQGIFTHAILHAVADTSLAAPHDAIDYVMEVGYLTERGYEAVQAQFAEIRKQHKTVLINGRGLKELGTIIGERLLLSQGTA